jgi:hypothetical protein
MTYEEIRQEVKAIDQARHDLTATWYKQAIKEAVTSRDNAEISGLHTRYALQYGMLLDIPCDVTLKTIKGGETK